MHGITYLLLPVLLVCPLLVGQLGALILELFRNVIGQVVVPKGQLLVFAFEPCCPAHIPLHTVLFVLVILSK